MFSKESPAQVTMPNAQPSMPVVFATDFKVTREILLREMARIQRLDGSWEGDVEYTAAALLAFVRTGHTTSASIFRQALRRAAAWLVNHTGSGFASRVRAKALRELANHSGDARMHATADAAEAGLKDPQTELEVAAASETAPASLTRAENLNDLRLAGWFGLKVEVASELGKEPLARAWAVLVM
jgi:hypothetical protein